MPHHGYTNKHCYHCCRMTSHAIVESDGFKLFICTRRDQHEGILRELPFAAAYRQTEKLPELRQGSSGEGAK